MKLNNYVLLAVICILIAVISFYFGYKQAKTGQGGVLTDTTTIYIPLPSDTVKLPSETKFIYIYKTLPAIKDTIKDSNLYFANFDSLFVSEDDTIKLKSYVSFDSGNKVFDLSQDLKHTFDKVFIHDTTIVTKKIPYYLDKEIPFLQSREFGFGVGAILTFVLALLLG